MDKFSVETESATARGNLCDASVFNKIRDEAVVRIFTVISQAITIYF